MPSLSTGDGDVGGVVAGRRIARSAAKALSPSSTLTRPGRDQVPSAVLLSPMAASL
jgi:hypothetical protein